MFQNILKQTKLSFVAVIAFTVLAMGVLAPINTSVNAQVVTTPNDGMVMIDPMPTPLPVSPVLTKLQCKLYATMIKNLITKIKLMHEEKMAYFESQLALLYIKLEAAFLSGDVALYNSIQAQIDAIEAQINQLIYLYNQLMAVLNQALTEALKTPCNIQLVKSLLSKAMAYMKEYKILCDKIMVMFKGITSPIDPTTSPL
jgi:hypothetical protein